MKLDPAFWRDVDSECHRYGLCVWAWGAELCFGRRMYRARLAWRAS